MKTFPVGDWSHHWQQAEAALRVECEILAMRDANMARLVPVEFRREAWVAEVPRRQPKYLGKGRHF